MGKQLTSWKEYLENDILAWWSSHGADDESGGVLTCFNNDGELLETTKYTWSQGRWAWLCSELVIESKAGRIDIDEELWKSRAIDTASFLTDNVILADGTTVFKTTQEGTPLPSGPDNKLSASVFADLFVVLGLAGASRVVDDPERFLQPAETILQQAVSSISDRTALSEPYPVPEGFTDLAAPMSVLHAAAEVVRADPSRPQATSARDWAASQLLSEQGFLFAYDNWWEFKPDPGKHSESLLAQHRTPGHLLELTWMLLHARDDQGVIGPVTVQLDQLLGLALKAFEIGWDDECGGLFRYTHATGGAPTGPLIAETPTKYEQLVLDTWDTKLWWVHSEAMYAAALLAELTQDQQMLQWKRRIIDYSMKVFPDPMSGEWLQIRHRSGDPLDRVVALPVKDPMHIARSILFLNRLENPSQEQ